MSDILVAVKQRILKNCVQEEDCLIWKGPVVQGKKSDSGSVGFKNKKYIIHTVILRVKFPLVDYDHKKHRVERTCGNDLCCNDAHYELAFLAKNDDEYWKEFVKNGTRTESGCLLWNLSKNPGGYGMVAYNGKHSRVHRVAYKLKVGAIVKDQVIRHKCSNRSCFEPDHLEIGSEVDNSADKRRDGTAIFGEKSPMAKITEATAKLVIDSKRPMDHPEYETQRVRAAKFGVSESIVAQIDAGTTWTHLQGIEGTNKASLLRTQVRQANRKKPFTNDDFDKMLKRLSKKYKVSETTFYENTACHDFTGCLCSYGYGQVSVSTGNMAAHRVMYFASGKTQPDPKVVIRHMCHNKKCINILHLKVGTQTDNAIDTLLDDKRRKTLKVEDVRKGESKARLAEKFQVLPKTIYDIVKRKTWKFIE